MRRRRRSWRSPEAVAKPASLSRVVRYLTVMRHQPMAVQAHRSLMSICVSQMGDSLPLGCRRYQEACYGYQPVLGRLFSQRLNIAPQSNSAIDTRPAARNPSSALLISHTMIGGELAHVLRDFFVEQKQERNWSRSERPWNPPPLRAQVRFRASACNLDQASYQRSTHCPIQTCTRPL